MKNKAFNLTLIAGAVFALAACESAEDKAKAAADRPNTEGTTGQEIAARVTTPQASLTPAEREQLRELAKGYVDSVAEQNAPDHQKAPGFEDEVVALQPAQSHNWTVNLKGGVVYRIIAGCDNECSNLDLELLQNGRVVEADTLPDDAPILNISPSADTTYTVRMTMKTCTIAPCYSAARVYQKS